MVFAGLRAPVFASIIVIATYRCRLYRFFGLVTIMIVIVIEVILALSYRIDIQHLEKIVCALPVVEKLSLAARIVREGCVILTLLKPQSAFGDKLIKF